MMINERLPYPLAINAEKFREPRTTAPVAGKVFRNERPPAHKRVFAAGGKKNVGLEGDVADGIRLSGVYFAQ